MVQRKASNKLAGCPTEPRNRGKGGAGGGSDHMKMPRKRRPNYMNPTGSSEARREKPQVTTIHSRTSINYEPGNHAKPSSSSPLRPCINKAIMATCSSTLKNSKFPKALELQPGGTEAEGTSAMRVCPYSYCSLNGHWHEPLPPLKSFISAKRKLLNTQKSFKLKGLPLFKVKGPVKDEEEMVNDFFLGISATVEEFQDLQLQSFGERNTQNELNHTDEYYSDMHMGDDLDEKSNRLIEEFDSILSLLEYVEFDETIEAGGEVKEGREPTGMPTLNATSTNWGEEEVSITNHKSNFSDYPDDILGPIPLSSSEKETIGDELSFEPSSVLCDMAEADAEQLIELVKLETKQNFKDEIPADVIFNDGTEGEDMDDEIIEELTMNHNLHNQSDEKNKDRSCDAEGSIQRYTKQDSLEIKEETQTEDENNYDTDDVYILTAYRSSEDEAKNNATTNTNQPLAETADVAKERTRVTRKRTSEETEEMKEFNPRSPRFLEIEPEPEAEKVDLRHQTTDERKNTEEWMLDYALQRVISKLDPARKRKVGLLVKAFESMMPPSTGEEPLLYSTSSFPHTTIIQPCR